MQTAGMSLHQVRIILLLPLSRTWNFGLILFFLFVFCSQHPIHMPTSGQFDIGNIGAGFRQEALPDPHQRAFPGGLAAGLHRTQFRADCSRTGFTRSHHWAVRGTTEHVLRRDQPARVTGHTGGNSG